MLATMITPLSISSFPSVLPVSDSQIGDLEQHYFAISTETVGKVAAEYLEANPHIPGVIITSSKKNNQFVGMISRRNCFEQLGKPYGVEVYLNRMIKLLYEALGISPTILPASMSIEEAVSICLNRPTAEAYEPIVVQHGPEDYRLLEFTTLLRAESCLLENANHQVKSFNRELEEMVRQRTNQLQAAYTQLETLDKAKSDFISVASHELRTPLTVISGYVQMMDANPAVQTDPQLAATCSGAKTGVQRLHEIVNSMLDVARIDNRQLDLHLIEVDLCWLAAELGQEFTPKAAERNLRLELADFSAALPVRGDSNALRKVFQNLLYNAIKYTPDGGLICLDWRFGDLGNGQPKPAIELVVEDSGVGIAPEYHELVFEKFFGTGKVSLHSSGRTKFKGGGTGLGLAIAKGIIDAHGGKIWVESPGYDETHLPGSRFHVLLPALVPEDGG